MILRVHFRAFWLNLKLNLTSVSERSERVKFARVWRLSKFRTFVFAYLSKFAKAAFEGSTLGVWTILKALSVL